MRIETGYRASLLLRDDANMYSHPMPGMIPVTRIIPDCGHTFFLSGQDIPAAIKAMGDNTVCHGCRLREQYARINNEIVRLKQCE